MKQWEKDAEYGSDILGVGSGFGNLTGKVKTDVIGFIRPKCDGMRNKNRVSKSGRGKASTARPTQKSR